MKRYFGLGMGDWGSLEMEEMAGSEDGERTKFGLQLDSLLMNRQGNPLELHKHISPGNLDSSLCFFQPSVSHDVPCIQVK